MRNFEEIGKALPYRETDNDVDAIIDRITAATIAGADSRRHRAAIHRLIYTASAVAAVIALFATVAIKTIADKPSTYDSVMQSESVAEVLNQMGDDAVEGEVYYTQNALADYYY